MQRNDGAADPSHDRYRLLVEQSNDGIFLADAQGNYLEVNPAGCAMLGYTEAELIGMNLRDLIAADDRAASEAQTARLAAGTPVRSERRLRRKDGTFIVAEISAWPTSDGFLHASVRDVTQHRAAEEQLRVNEERLRTVISNTPVVLAAVDRNGIFTLSEGKGLAAVGMEPGQAVGMSIFELYANDSDNVEAAHRVLRGESFVVQIRVGEGVFESHYEPIRDGDGNVTGAIAVGIDVTDRANALEEARRNRQYLESVISSAPLVLAALDRDGIFTLAEGAALANIGRQRGDAVGASVWERYRDTPDLLDAIRRALGGASSKLEVRLSDRVFDTYASPLRDERGAITGAVLVGVDVSERKRLEEQFLQAQKMETIGRLAGGVAHDVNNLMTVIIGTTDLVLDTLGRDHPAVADVREISEVAQRAGTLANQLLAFSRRQMIQPGVVNLNNLVANTQRMLTRLIGEDVDLQTVLAPDLGQVNVDVSQFQQLLVNLAVNSRDAMPDGGRLIVETENVVLGAKDMVPYGEMQPGRYVMLTFSDTGTGMSEDVQAHAFEPFFTTKEVGRGTGLGLAAAYGIAKQAGGDISVQSEVGRGTTFKILLPRIDAGADGAARADVGVPDSLPRGAETILLVEDEADVRGVAARILLRLGYSVIEASDGATALRVAATVPGRIDLLLTDLVMPSMGGRELGVQLTALRPSMRVLLTSGYADDAALRMGADAAAVAFLRKPFSSRLLAEKVREVLDAPR
jgi:two-component system cell cycle sensor histidine kinase/response regulator CckA